MDIASLDGRSGRQVGEVLARSRTADVADGHVGAVVLPEDVVLTSDPDDIRRILRARSVHATVRRI